MSNPAIFGSRHLEQLRVRLQIDNQLEFEVPEGMTTKAFRNRVYIGVAQADVTRCGGADP